MLPPKDYEDAARQAECHLQLAIEDVTVASDKAYLSGPVVKLFRGPPDLPGTRLRLEVGCLGPADASPPDGIGLFPVDALKAGRVLEALVNHPLSTPEIALGLCTIIDSATDEPQLQVRLESKNRLNAKAIAVLAAVVLGIVSLLGAVFLLR